MRIYIIGTVEHWQDTDWDDGDEYWGMNQGYRIQDIESFDRWFELHDLDRMYDDLSYWPEHLEWLRDPPLPVYLWQSQIDKHALSGKPLDPEPLLDEFGRYFTNTPSWMIGFAIMEGATSIALRGIDMATEWENRFERPSVEYLLGVAKGKGIEIDINSESDLLKTPYLYGLEQTDDMREALRFKLKEARRNEEIYRDVASQYAGSVDTLEYLLRNFYNDSEAIHQAVHDELE